MKKIAALTTFLFLISSVNGYAQCADNFPESFYEAARNAPIVVEGKILSETTRKFGREYHEIAGETNDKYRTHIMEVYKVLKGELNSERIEVITEPIAVRDIKRGSAMGEPIGVFVLHYNNIKEPTPHGDIPDSLKFRFAAPWICSFVNYNEGVFYSKYPDPKSIYGFESYKDIRKVIYEPLEKMTGKAYREIKKWEKKSFFGTVPNAEKKTKSSLVTPTITGFHPDTIPAGIFDTLSIVGHGFDTSHSSQT